MFTVEKGQAIGRLDDIFLSNYSTLQRVTGVRYKVGIIKGNGKAHEDGLEKKLFYFIKLKIN